MQDNQYATMLIQPRLKRIKLIHMTPECVPAPENESNVALTLPVSQKLAWYTFLGTPFVKGTLGLLIGIGLLAPEKVIAMAIFFHPWSGLLMCAMGMVSLSSLGLAFSHTLKLQTQSHLE